MNTQEIDFQIYNKICDVYFEFVEICLPILQEIECPIKSVKDEKSIFKPKKRKFSWRDDGNFELKESKTFWRLLDGLPDYKKEITIKADSFTGSFLFYNVVNIKYQYEQIIPTKRHRWYFSEKSKPKSLL